MQIQGSLSVFMRKEKTGRLFHLYDQHNLIVYQAADIMASLVRGNIEDRINSMYLIFENTSLVPTPLVIDRTVEQATFATWTGADHRDWLRVPMVTDALIQTSDNTKYDGNTATFTATSAASPTMTGESPAHNPFSDNNPPDGPSKIFAATLVAAPVIGDNTKDKVFSVVNLTTPLTMEAGSHYVLFWSLRFN